jgi:hypothetical protein
VRTITTVSDWKHTTVSLTKTFLDLTQTLHPNSSSWPTLSSAVLFSHSPLPHSSPRARVDPTVTITETLERAQSVFRGVVIPQLNNYEDYYNYVVRVSRVFKGCDFRTNERIIVATGRDDCICGLSLEATATSKKVEPSLPRRASAIAQL